MNPIEEGRRQEAAILKAKGKGWLGILTPTNQVGNTLSEVRSRYPVFGGNLGRMRDEGGGMSPDVRTNISGIRRQLHL